MVPALRLGQYVVEGLLGPGGVTETYRARRADGTGAPVALKLLRADRAGEHHVQVADQFLEAAREQAAAGVPGTGQILEISTEPAFVVMKLVPGRDLRKLAPLVSAEEAGPRADRELLAALIGAEVASTLAAAHEREPPLFHLGLGPGDVLVTDEGRVVVLDFGVFAAVRALAETAFEPWCFLPGEALSGAAPTPAADVYGVGALVYHLVTGSPPAGGNDVHELAAALRRDPPPLRGSPGHLGTALRALLAPDPRDRPPSAAVAASWLAPELTTPAERQRRIRELLAQLEGRSVGDAPPRAAAPASNERRATVAPSGKAESAPRRSAHVAAAARSWRPLLVGGAALVMLAAGVGALLASKPRREPMKTAPVGPAPAVVARSPEIPPAFWADAGAARPPVANPLPRVPGRFKLDTEPAGALVWIDGVERGTTPLDVHVGPGGHRVVAILPGHRMWRDVIDGTPGELMRRRLVPVPSGASTGALLTVDCRTRGKFPVLIDGDETGLLCPAIRVPVAPGKHAVSIFIPAERRYVEIEQEVAPGRSPAVARFPQ